jgi:hypothetical protein
VRAQFLKELEQQTQKIKALVAATLAFKEANTISDELQKQNEKLADSTRGFQERTAALLVGGNAIDKALNDEKLAPYLRAVEEASKRLDELQQMQGVTAVEVTRAKQALAEANAELDKHRQLLAANSNAEIDFQIAQEVSYEQQTDKKIAALKRFAETHSLTSGQQLIVEGKILDLQRSQLQEYDNLLLKTNSARNGVQAFFNQLSLNGKNAARDISDSLGKAFDQLSQHLTNFIVNGQLNLKQLAASIEQDFIGKAVKNSLTTGLTKLGGLLGINTGTVTKPDGSTESNALWVQIAGNGLLGAGPNPDTLSSILKIPSAVPGLDGTSSQGFFGKLGGLFSKVMGIFGGFLEAGGNVSPGKAYIVGERRPELFMPSAPGRIVPNPNAMGSGKGQLVVSQTMNINTPDANSFRKSQSQIMAEGYAAAAMAHARNR